MWAERGISPLFFNIVPTDIDVFVSPLHELQEPLLVKFGVLGPYGCFSVFIGGQTAPIKCSFQSREEVKVARGSVVGRGTMLQAGRSRDRILVRSLDFQLT
jgi:hypothetical protein